MHNKRLIVLGSIFMAIGVGLGAFGAHSLEPLLLQNDRVDTFETAVLYHFVHALGILILGISQINNSKAPALLFTAGIIFFSGSLYVLSLTNTLWLGAVAPIGGTAFIAGWVLLAWKVYRS